MKHLIASQFRLLQQSFQSTSYLGILVHAMKGEKETNFKKETEIFAIHNIKKITLELYSVYLLTAVMWPQKCISIATVDFFFVKKFFVFKINVVANS